MRTSNLGCMPSLWVRNHLERLRFRYTAGAAKLQNEPHPEIQ